MVNCPMASFFSKLFGGGSGNKDTSPKRGDPVPYEGLLIQAAPIPTDGQWRLAGFIIKETEDGNLERNFIRADLFTSREEAEQFAIRKGQQVVTEQGTRLFANGERQGRA
jgi:hypothetical protein